MPDLDHSAQADGGAISGVKACAETTGRCSSDNAARAEREVIVYWTLAPVLHLAPRRTLIK